MQKIPNLLLIISVLTSMIAATGCGPKISYRSLGSLMEKDDCTSSISLINDAEETYGKKAELLYLLDNAMIHMECGNYTLANRYFHDAEDLSRRLWTKSISTESAAMITNDLVLPYAGEDFERALINLFSAFAYIQMDDYENALVECRRLDTLLTEFNSKYDKKNIYKEDALGRYISGILSEIDGEFDEAYIYYYEAVRAYTHYQSAYGTTPPAYLIKDLLRVAGPADRVSEARALIPGSDAINYLPQKQATELGSIVFIHLSGTAPEKKETKFTITTPEGPVSIAFPEYNYSPPDCSGSTLTLRGDNTLATTAVLSEDISRIAVKNLEDRKGRVIAKAIARATLKHAAVNAAAKKAEEEQGEDVGQLLKITGRLLADLTERADTRSWRTLPGEIFLSRTFLPEGQYTLTVESCNGTSTPLDTVDLKKGKTRFVFHYDMY